MKKGTLLFGTFIILLFFSCSGPEGPPGFDGLNGLDGLDAPLSQVIDIEGDFTFANDYSILYEFPQTVEVFETDVVLVYLLWDQTEDSNGDPVDIWRLMPQTRILDQGLLQYNYDHTFLDVNLFIDADFDLATLPLADTDAQVFRIAILPAELAAGSKMDKSNVVNVMQTLGVAEKDIPRLKVN